MRKPLAIDLFCGLGGWTEGLLAEGYCGASRIDRCERSARLIHFSGRRKTVL